MKRFDRHNRKWRKGSLTVFAALSFFLIAQLLFTLAEGCRQTELQKVAVLASDTAVESAMADYCRPMWENYGLLCYDAGGSASAVSTARMEADMESAITADFAVQGLSIGKKYTNLLRLSAEEISVDSYTLMTDGNGSVFIKNISWYVQNNMLTEAATLALNNADAISYMEEESGFDLSLVKKALELFQKSKSDTAAESSQAAKNSAAGESAVISCNAVGENAVIYCNTIGESAVISCNAVGENRSSSGAVIAADRKDSAKTSAIKTASSSGTSSSSSEENILQQIQSSMEEGILGQVLPEGKSASKKKVTLSDLVSQRTLEQGMNPQTESVGIADWACMEVYMQNHLSSFTYSADSNEKALDYELEYVISGKGSDRENLECAVNDLLLIREAANMIYLYSSKSKQTELETAAEALAAATVQPELEKVYKLALAAAWAYVESLMDVRTLLDGGRIPLLKSDKTWSSNISSLGDLLKGKAKAKSVSTGLNYQEYLGVLLLTKTNSKMAYRTMDVQEAAVRKLSGYSDFRMDHAVCSVSASFYYTSDPLFLSFVNLVSTGKGTFSIHASSEFSYRGS